MKNKNIFIIAASILAAILALIISLTGNKPDIEVEPVLQENEIVEKVEEVFEYTEEELQNVLTAIEPGPILASADSMILSGIILPGISLYVFDNEVEIPESREINHEVKLEPEQTEVEMTARDEVGNEAKSVIEVEREEPKKQVVTSCDSQGSFNTQFICFVNNHRKANGKGTLSYSGVLNNSATSHSDWMKANSQLSHDEGDGSNPATRCIAQGTACSAENVAMGFTSAEHLFNLWKTSPIHNKNMLGNYSLLGLGISGSYATALFN